MTPVSFRVYGDPVPQPRPRVSTFGGHARAYVQKTHPIHAFREAVRLAALAAGVQRSTGPVEVSILAVFARPPSHRKADGSLRAGAPLYPGHRCGDSDNLAKGILDGLQGVAFDDDDQADLGYVRRRYGKTAFVEVSVSEFEPEDHGEGL
jgi:Holliday junction resolvase RusA-like endonuclease